MLVALQVSSAVVVGLLVVTVIGIAVNKMNHS
jgi:hypothetical protein